jgi:hypothetical protein
MNWVRIKATTHNNISVLKMQEIITCNINSCFQFPLFCPVCAGSEESI